MHASHRVARAAVALLTLGLLAGVVIFYAGLIGMSQWGADEYVQLPLYWRFGIHEYLVRVFGWSPRPVSEPLLWLYALAVKHGHRPFIVPFLSLLWGVVALATVVTISPSRYRGVLRYRLLLALALLAMFLLGHPVSELFYWPSSSVAYLPTLAAIVASFLLPMDRRGATAGRAFAGTTALLIAAGSSEVGALFVLCLSAVRLPRLLAERPRRAAAFLHWAAPVALSLAVVAVLLRVRVGVHELLVAHTPYLHRPLVSLKAAVSQVARELATLDGGRLNVASVTTALLVRLLFFLGIRWTWQAADRGGEPVQGMVGFAAACVAAAYAVLVASDDQFGMLCCERHAALRQCLFVLAVAALAVRSASADGRIHDLIAPVPLALAVLIPLADTGVAALRHDYQLYRTAIATRAWNWHEGMRRGTNTMVFENAPLGRITHTSGFPLGRFTLTDKNRWPVNGIMLFFGKRAIEIRPPPAGSAHLGR